MQILVLTVLALLVLAGDVGYELLKSQRSRVATELQSTNRQVMSQATTTLVAEASDVDGDGYPEPLAGKTGVFADKPTFLALPATTAAPLKDAWGTYFGYCPFDHGSPSSSTGRLAGAASPAVSVSSFWLVSAGPDKKLSVSCPAAGADIEAKGDDVVRKVTISQVQQGISLSQYWGAPVADAAALNALNPASLKIGETRVQMDTKVPYTWTGTAWVSIGGGGSSGPIAPSYSVTPPTILEQSGMPVLTQDSQSVIALAADGKLYAAGKNTTDNSTYSNWADLSSTTKLTWYELPNQPSKPISGILPNFGGYFGGTFVRTQDGEIYATGKTAAGVVAGTATNYPTWMLADTNVKKAAVINNGIPGQTLLTLKNDNNLYAKGNAFPSGQLTTTGSVATFAADGVYGSSSGNSYCIARVDTDGQLWLRGTVTTYCPSSTSFQAVLAGVSAISVSVDSASTYANMVALYALKSDGSVWVMGSANGVGQLGIGSTERAASFTDTGLRDVALIASAGSSTTMGCAYAVKSDGTLWSAGYNGRYNLGIEGSTANKSSWTQASITGVNGVYPHPYCYNLVVTKTDGTVWGIGEAPQGQFGQGTAGKTYTTWTRLL